MLQINLYIGFAHIELIIFTHLDKTTFELECL